MLLSFILLLPSLLMHTQETAQMRIAVRPPGVIGFTGLATVIINGKTAQFSESDFCYRFDAVIGEKIEAVISMSGAETARLHVTGHHHSNSIERYDVQLGTAGSQYLREGFKLNPVQPDDSRIGIIKPGQTNEEWKNDPELKKLLDNLGLEVDSGYGKTGNKDNSQFSKIIVPFLVLKRKDNKDFDASSAIIYKEFEIRDYKWGVFLMKDQLSLVTFPFTLHLASSVNYSGVVARFETLDIKSSSPVNSTKIQITPYYTPGSPASWIELINQLGELEGVNSVSPEQYSYRTLGF